MKADITYSEVGMHSTALFSDDGLHRLTLSRRLSVGNRRVCFVMLNPSVANETKNDPTMHEVIGWTARLAFHAVDVVNLFTRITPHPRDLLALHRSELGCGLDADVAILTAAEGADMTIAAWGNGGSLHGRAAEVVVMLLRSPRVRLCHFGRTKHGHPKHPLARGVHRIPRSLTPIAWE